MSCEDPSSAQRPTAEPSRDISGLSDVDLALIFNRLPLHDLVPIFDVCKRWRDVSSMIWRRIIHLDLSLIPGPKIAAILNQCANLQTVSAERKTFGFEQLHVLSCIALTSVSLHHCSVTVRLPRLEKNADRYTVNDPLSAVFSSDFQNAHWAELILNDFKIVLKGSVKAGVFIGFSVNLPASLKRLQVTDLTVVPDDSDGTTSVWLGFERYEVGSFSGREEQEQLECLMLSGSAANNDKNIVSGALFDPRLYHRVGALTHLRELFLSSHEGWFPELLPVSMLPKLEVLFIQNMLYCRASEVASFIKRLTTEHPTLRILILSGELSKQIELPARQRYPNGLDSDPLPVLHIFMDVAVSRMIRFSSALDAANAYVFNEPLAQFLEREEIKPLFEGVWIAAKIKELVKQGCSF